MKLRDILHLSFKTVTSYPTRSSLIVLAMALGIAAVIVLTALGGGARRYVLNLFSSIGSICWSFSGARNGGRFLVRPWGGTPDLTLEDARWIGHLHKCGVAPLNVGVELFRCKPATGSHRYRQYRQFFPIRHEARQGGFLTHGSELSAQIVLGAKLAEEFFPDGNAVGQRVRLADRRFIVSGVLVKQGETMGYNSDEIVVIPINHAQALFNTTSLFRILVEVRNRTELSSAKDAIRELLIQRHDGEDDVTIITLEAVLATFDRILRALTLGVAGIAAISLAVAGILVMNVMLVAVTQRTTEIGLLKAVGAFSTDIRRLFLAEAAWLSLAGAVFGILIGQLGSLLIRIALPQLPAWPPLWATLASILVALTTGMIAGLLPNPCGAA